MSSNRVAVRRLVMVAVILSLSAASFAQIGVGISVRFGPPALPVYAQPICPGAGYLWTPGYWGWNDDGGYYWVPGTWVMAPVGMLWTPGYWGWGGGFYSWNAGYWGPHVGFYGGINYGFGYGGVGFAGGEWRGGGFYYNRYVTNVSVTTVHTTYNRSVVLNNTTTSFNGGEGGVRATATAAEEAAAREPHTAALAEQTQHEHAASQNRGNFASENHGNPAVAATARPGDFSGRSAVAARSAGAEYHAPAMSPREARVGSQVGSKGSSSEGFRSFSSQATSPAASPVRGAEPSGSRPVERNPSRPSHSESTPRQNSRRSSPPSGPPKRQSAPKEAHHKGR